jgi:hypothetical protein
MFPYRELSFTVTCLHPVGENTIKFGIDSSFECATEDDDSDSKYGDYLAN